MKWRGKTGYPSGWSDFQNHAVHTGADFFGFKADIAEVNRFAARFRVAKCFKGLRLDGYSSNTEAGYGALCRVLFAYSAFETYLEISGNTQSSISGSLSASGAEALMARIRVLDTRDRFYKFIYERVNSTHRRELDNYFNHDPCNVTYLASAIRHIFAHGWLSPSAGGSESAEAVRICDAIADFLLSFLDSAFRQHVDAGCEVIYKR